MTLPLPELMTVLDHVDAAQGKREALIQATLALNTGHQSDDVVAGVDAYLSAPLSVSGQPTRVLNAFDFGWNRPGSEAEQVAQALNYRPARWGRHSRGAHLSRPGKFLGAGVGSAVFLVVTLVGAHFGHLWHGVGFGLMLGSIAGVIGMLMTEAVVDGCAAAVNPYQESVLAEDELETFLSFPSSRAYLRALRLSGCARVLMGDHERLKVLCQEGVAARQKATAQAVRQQQLAQQNARLDALLAIPENPSESIT